jgi:hypothetical protein
VSGGSGMNNHKLDFVVVGPARAGTTWIDEYLRRHKDVCLPEEVKEIHFFNFKYDKGLDWYFSHFQPHNTDQIVGEVCPTYFHLPQVAQRIYEVNPNCKIICTLRNPIDRSSSLYVHMMRYGYLKPGISFKEAVKERPVLVESSRYHTHVTRWREYFGEQNVCILMYDDLKRDSVGFVKTLCDFLGLQVQGFPEELKKAVNVSEFPINFTLARNFHRLANLLENYKLYFLINAGKRLGLNKLVLGGRKAEGEISGEDRRYLYGFLKEEIDGLERLLNLDLSSWRFC